jgi:hypothetical protein
VPTPPLSLMTVIGITVFVFTFPVLVAAGGIEPGDVLLLSLKDNHSGTVRNKPVDSYGTVCIKCGTAPVIRHKPPIIYAHM